MEYVPETVSTVKVRSQSDISPPPPGFACSPWRPLTFPPDFNLTCHAKGQFPYRVSHRKGFKNNHVLFSVFFVLAMNLRKMFLVVLGIEPRPELQFPPLFMYLVFRPAVLGGPSPDSM